MDIHARCKSLPVTLNAYDGYDYRKKIVKKLCGATYGNVVSVLSVHHQASVTVAEVEDAWLYQYC